MGIMLHMHKWFTIVLTGTGSNQHNPFTYSKCDNLREPHEYAATGTNWGLQYLGPVLQLYCSN